MNYLDALTIVLGWPKHIVMNSAQLYNSFLLYHISPFNALWPSVFIASGNLANIFLPDGTRPKPLCSVVNRMHRNVFQWHSFSKFKQFCSIRPVCYQHVIGHFSGLNVLTPEKLPYISCMSYHLCSHSNALPCPISVLALNSPITLRFI